MTCCVEHYEYRTKGQRTPQCAANDTPRYLSFPGRRIRPSNTTSGNGWEAIALRISLMSRAAPKPHRDHRGGDTTVEFLSLIVTCAVYEENMDDKLGL